MNFNSLTERKLIRKRPGMFIGGVDERALHHMVYIGLDHATNDALNDNSSRIWITLGADEEVTIQHERTHFADAYPAAGMALEFQMTRGGSAVHYYQAMGGLHGLDLAIINALSAEFGVEVWQDNTLWQQRYRECVPQAPVTKIEPAAQAFESGVRVTFKPDFTILEPNKFDYDTLAKRCREIAYLIPNVRVSLRDERHASIREETFHAPQGIINWIEFLNAAKTPLHPIITARNTADVYDQHGKLLKIVFECAFQYTGSTDHQLIAYLNSVETPQGGSHVTAFLEGLRRVVKQQRQQATWTRQLTPGLTAFVSVLHPSPKFESPTKVKLITPEVEKLARQTVRHALHHRPEVLDAIAHHVS